jgi:hypothetical protein
MTRRAFPNGCHGLTRRASRAACTLLAAITLATLPACNTDEPADTDSVETSTTVGDLIATLAASDTEITTTDRIELTLTAVYPQSQAVTLRDQLVEALEAADWTIISLATTPPTLAGDRLTHTTTAVIEPWLPGDAAIPAIELDFEGQLATLGPIPITVTSLLAEGDALAESPELADLRAPPPAADDNTSALPIVISIVVVFGGVLFIIRRNATAPAGPSPAEDLRSAEHTARRIADASTIDADGLAALHAAVRTAEHHTQAADPVLTADLEHARFGPMPPSARRCAELAGRTEAFVRTAHEMFLVEHKRGGAHA